MFGNGVLAVFVTTLVSAFIHEYLIAMALGFASPMLIIEFAGLGGEGKYYYYFINEILSLNLMFCSAIFYVVKPLNIRRLSNFLVLLALSVGGANLLFYYQVEYAARIYCPQKVFHMSFSCLI